MAMYLFIFLITFWVHFILLAYKAHVEMSSTHLIIANPWRENDIIVDKKLLSMELCDISDKVLKVAETELREDEKTRKQCLEHLRDWIKKNQDLENCFTDDKFLLRFLRVKKFSIPMAEQTLLKYLSFRKRFREFMYGLDYLQSPLIQNGYIFASPFRDSNGRRVVFYNLKKINPQEVTGKDVGFAHAITYETLLTEEENQILGVSHVADIEGLSAPFLTLWSVTDFATIIRWGEQSMPMRHKAVHVLNFPSAFKYVYEFAQSNIRSQKLRERISIHGSLSELHNKMNRQCLPLELGGMMPMKEMIELWKQELAAKRELLLSYDTMNLLSDRGIICRRNKSTQDDTGVGSLPGSFRKLEVD